mgnify:CR=1 FL=1
MSLRQLPPVQARDDMRSLDTNVVPGALDRWNVGVRAADGSTDNTISIYDVIGEDPWSGNGVTAKRIAAALRSIGSRDVVVNVNSPGGDLFEGIAIYNLLREHPHQVTVKVVSLAASAASIIAMAGDRIEVAKSGFVMIHNAWVLAIGNRHDLREVADTLEPFDASIRGIYEARTGIADADLAQMMDKETWLTGSQAVDQGFADALLPSDQVAEDAKAAADMAPVLAMRQVDVALARQGMPRAKRRDLIREIKSGTPGAAASATPSAGDSALAAELLRAIAIMKS